MDIKNNTTIIRDYISGSLRGLCVEGYETLDLFKIPWDEIKKKQFPGYELVKASHTRRVIKMQFSPGGTGDLVTLYLKRMRVRKLRRAVGCLFTDSKGCGEWNLGYRVRKHNILTPLPVIYAERRAYGILRESYVALTALEGKVSFADAFRICTDKKRRRRGAPCPRRCRR